MPAVGMGPECSAGSCPGRHLEAPGKRRCQKNTGSLIWENRAVYKPEVALSGLMCSRSVWASDVAYLPAGDQDPL